MKQLGPHKKYVILAIVIQSIAVILLGYYLFKSRAAKNAIEDPPRPATTIEQKSTG